MNSDEVVIDLSENPNLDAGFLRAEAKGTNVLILRKLKHPVRRLDKRRVSYEIELRWLSQVATAKGGEVCCVRGNEFTYWSTRELREAGIFRKHSCLFDCFFV